MFNRRSGRTLYLGRLPLLSPANSYPDFFVKMATRVLDSLDPDVYQHFPKKWVQLWWRGALGKGIDDKFKAYRDAGNFQDADDPREPLAHLEKFWDLPDVADSSSTSTAQSGPLPEVRVQQQTITSRKSRHTQTPACVAMVNRVSTVATTSVDTQTAPRVPPVMSSTHCQTETSAVPLNCWSCGQPGHRRVDCCVRRYQNSTALGQFPPFIVNLLAQQLLLQRWLYQVFNIVVFLLMNILRSGIPTPRCA